MTDRIKGKTILIKLLKNEKSAIGLEKLIFEKSIEIFGNDKSYRNTLYHVITDINNGQNLKSILAYIKEGKIDHYHKSYDEVGFRQNEQDEYLINPFTIQEGVIDCGKCGSKKVFSYQKQTRSGDESITSFFTCSSCNNKWSCSG